MTVLEMIQRTLAGETVDGFRMQLPPTVATTIGFDAVSVEHGEAVFRLQVQRARHANPMGTVHGGVLCDLADAAMGMACASLLGQGESFTTLELKMNFLRPVVEGEIEARARVISGGKTMVYLECELVRRSDDKLVAKSSSTCLILRGEQAQGR